MKILVEMFQKFIEALSRLRADKDARASLLLAALSLGVFLPGILWGLPQADLPDTVRPWGLDEIGPMGPVAEPYNLLTHKEIGNVQYPMGHYFFVLVFDALYLGALFLTRGWTRVSSAYPFGFAHPVATIRTLLLIARGVSVLLGIGTVIVAYFTGKELRDRRAGLLAALFAMLAVPIFYYSRLSNVDVPALFWTALVLLLFVRSLREGLTVRRAVWLGLFAAMSAGSKDQSAAISIFFPPILAAAHFSAMDRQGRHDWKSKLGPLVLGGAVTLAAYAVVSGFLFWPEKYFKHLDFIRYGAMKGRFYFEYPATVEGFSRFFREVWRNLLDSTGWPMLLAAIAGAVQCWRSRKSDLWLLLTIPALVLFVLVPVRFVAIRFLLPVAYILALFAALAVSDWLQSGIKGARTFALAVAVAICAWLAAVDGDIVYRMWNDPRVAAADWMERHIPSGTRMECIGTLGLHSPALFPHLPRGVSIAWISGLPRADFVITKDPDDFEYRWFAARRVYDGMLDGSLGYVLAGDFETHSLFRHDSMKLQVVPRIRIFVHRDRTAQYGLAP